MNKHDLETYLLCRRKNQNILFQKALDIKQSSLGNRIYQRALIEISNLCQKNCYYCGIRMDNRLKRYKLSLDDIILLVKNIYNEGYRSLVIQSGEINSPSFTDYVAEILKSIHQVTHGEMHITLSCGEQSKETFKKWKALGAHRYLLRIETSNKELYQKIHPKDDLHSYRNRLECLYLLRELNYQVGSGVLIGFPGQSLNDLADDIYFLKMLDVDMIGCGPFIEHPHTPLGQLKDQLLPGEERLQFALNVIAILRIMMNKINIASTTALETLSPNGRTLALMAGANVIMNNFTPRQEKQFYHLYPHHNRSHDLHNNHFFNDFLKQTGQILSQDWGDSLHFQERISESNKLLNQTPSEKYFKEDKC